MYRFPHRVASAVIALLIATSFMKTANAGLIYAVGSLSAWNDPVVHLYDATGAETSTITNTIGTGVIDLDYDHATGDLYAMTFSGVVRIAPDGTQTALNSVSLPSARDNHQNIAVMSSVVPEPSTFALLGMGVIGLIGYRRRKREQTA